MPSTPVERPAGSLDSIVLVDGQVIRGIVTHSSASSVTIRLRSGDEQVIRREQVRALNVWAPALPASAPATEEPAQPATATLTEPRPRTDGILLEWRVLAIGSGGIATTSYGRSGPYFGTGVTAGYRYGTFEAGLEFSAGGTGSLCVLCANANPQLNLVTLAGFGGAIFPMSDTASFELRGKLGAQFASSVKSGYGSTEPDATTFGLFGIEPRLSFRFGGESVAFVLGIGAFLDIALGGSSLTQPAQPSSSTGSAGFLQARGDLFGPPPDPGVHVVNFNGVNAGAMISVGINFR